ncbi:MAG: formimidoylglutamate deiminase [Halioglobus sp.]|jgi:formimidoylglutamate deiminase
MTTPLKELYAKSALLADGWARNVQITIDDQGFITRIKENQASPGHNVERLQGVLLPGMANCHSHAFQRAMIGMAEQRSRRGDDFWGWRDTLYRFLAAIGPQQLQSIAAQLYVEMLKAGFTSVAEFHYLHHAPGGASYDDPAEMSHAIIRGALDAGIQLTLLPVLYQFSDFGGVAAGPQQQRFLHDGEGFQRLLEQLATRYPNSQQLNHGMALHSLRAVDEPLLHRGVATLKALHPNGPIHIHIAEQEKEVEAALTHTGQRPVDWLLDHCEVDAQWCLVHATHLNKQECQRLAASKAVAGLCPTTEANLGDGLFPAVDFLAQGGHFALGSDSHISVNPVEELRLLEYGQRLTHRRRTLLANDAHPSVGAHLYTQALRGGAQALGIEAGAVAEGLRADFLVLDDNDPTLYGKHNDQLLDSWIFASQRPNVKDVMVAGRWQIRDGRHIQEEKIQRDYFRTIDRLTCRA